jgi:DNA-binding response OmpR family regulator
MKILIADDDRDLVDLLTYWLKGHGYDILRAYDGEQAIATWRAGQPDLVLLDIGMPKVDGLEVCRQMSAESSAFILFLTGYDGEEDEVRALDRGADDYLRKPFSPAQLLARIRAVSRRATTTPQTSNTSLVRGGPLALDAMRHEVMRNGDGARVRLTPIESRLLYLLMTHPGQVLPTALIVERVWGYADADGTGLVKTHIRHLRQKVEQEPNAPRLIVTIPGVGYSFAASAARHGAEGKPEV